MVSRTKMTDWKVIPSITTLSLSPFSMVGFCDKTSMDLKWPWLHSGNFAKSRNWLDRQGVHADALLSMCTYDLSDLLWRRRDLDLSRYQNHDAES